MERRNESVVDFLAGGFVFLGIWFTSGLFIYIITSRVIFENRGLIVSLISFVITLGTFGFYRYQDFKNIKVSQSYLEYVSKSKRKDYLGCTVMNYGEMTDLPLTDIHRFDVNGDNYIGQFVMRRRNNYGATIQMRDKYYKALIPIILNAINLEETTCYKFWEILHEYSGADEAFNRLEGIPKNFLVGYYPLFNRDIFVEKESPMKQIEKMIERMNGEIDVESIMDEMFLKYYKDISVESSKTGEICEIDYLIVEEEHLTTIQVIHEGYVSYVVDSAGYLYDEAKKATQEKHMLVHPINRQNDILREIYGKFMRINNIVVFTGETINLKNNFESPTIHIVEGYKLAKLLNGIDQEGAVESMAKLKAYIIDDRLYTRYDLIADYNTMVQEANDIHECVVNTLDILNHQDDFLLKRKTEYKEWIKKQNYLFYGHKKYMKRFERHVDDMFSMRYVFGVENAADYKVDLLKVKRLLDDYIMKLAVFNDEIHKVLE